jgi:hypothetical protein
LSKVTFGSEFAFRGLRAIIAGREYRSFFRRLRITGRPQRSHPRCRPPPEA